MSKIIFVTFLTIFTSIPLFLRYLCMKKYERLKAKLREQEDESYYECIFFGPTNFSCRPHLIGKQDCGDYCSYTYLQRLIHYLNSAKSSISMCMYTLTLNQIAAILVTASQRGVRVRLITDKTMSKSTVSKDIFGGLKKNGVEIKMPKSSEQLMHHKYCLIDEKDKLSAKMFFGSANATTQAFCKNFESMILTNNWDMIEKLSEEYEELWNMFDN
ncbi:mitochondrial cardiolipin hydrolase-like isoform X2 [Sitophilus oryzae]|uniref:Mitochondrial cardiolipin hydrolase n=1 Tax=Sitophilus oryzae TaxID=7048 RepID=A0A6J2XK44_SITOR|nr:mitochondrial cardiolipin hydrolase-like isoform X2 [Sitophilus oryzae]